jgi:hypothetical protein
MTDFWLYKWMDEYGVASQEDGRRLLKPGSSAVRRLADIAASVTWEPLAPYRSESSAILAGRGIDLSGDLDCCHLACQIDQVDALFRRTLHYFDRIIISGPPAHRFVDGLERADEQALYNLVEHVAALLYLRRIGVTNLAVFVQKPPACQEHYVQHATDAGLIDLIERAKPWVERLAREGEVIFLRAHEDHWHFQFSHPDLEHNVFSVVGSTPDCTRPSKRDIAEVVHARYVAHLVSDVTASRALSVPLGASVQLHEDVLVTGAPPTVTVEDVAFDLYLPVLEDLPINDVARLRRDEWEYFEAFRQALLYAIEQRLHDGSPSLAVAERVAREVLDPALADLDKRLRVAERVATRKSAASIAIGGVVTTVGLLTGAPMVTAAGVAAMGTSVAAAHKYFEERGLIESSDMYWLWHLHRTVASRKH